jgi:hypothetical protein
MRKLKAARAKKPIGVEHRVGLLKDVIKRLRRGLVVPIMDQVADLCEKPRSKRRKAELRDASCFIRDASLSLRAAVDLLTPSTPEELAAMASGEPITALLALKKPRRAA